MTDEEKLEVQEQTAKAIADWLKEQGHGHGLLRSIRANGARDALYDAASKVEHSWPRIVLPRTATPTSTVEQKP